ISISLFRTALRDDVDVRIASRPASIVKPVAVVDPKWRWALVAVTAVVLAVVPFIGWNTFSPQHAIEKTQAESDADALMRTVNLQLSRTLPAPLEPVIALLPVDESPKPSGDIQ